MFFGAFLLQKINTKLVSQLIRANKLATKTAFSVN